MSNPTVLLQDNTAPERVTTVSADDVAATVGHWLRADGASSTPSANVSSLVRAIRAENWQAVHALADHLSLSVTLVESGTEAAEADHAAAEVFDNQPTEAEVLTWQIEQAAEVLADQADGWGLLGGIGS